MPPRQLLSQAKNMIRSDHRSILAPLHYRPGIWQENRDLEEKLYHRHLPPWLHHTLRHRLLPRLLAHFFRHTYLYILTAVVALKCAVIHPVDITHCLHSKRDVIDNVYPILAIMVAWLAVFTVALQKDRVSCLLGGLDLFETTAFLRSRQMARRHARMQRVCSYVTAFFHVVLIPTFIVGVILYTLFVVMPKRKFFFRGWYPYDDQKTPAYEITLFVDIAFYICMFTSANSSVSLLICMFIHIVANIKILSTSLANIVTTSTKRIKFRKVIEFESKIRGAGRVYRRAGGRGVGGTNNGYNLKTLFVKDLQRPLLWPRYGCFFQKAVIPVQSYGRYGGLFQKDVIPVQSHGRYGGLFQKDVIPMPSHRRYSGSFQKDVIPVQSHRRYSGSFQKDVNPVQSHRRYSGSFQKDVNPVQSHGRYGGLFQKNVIPMQSHGRYGGLLQKDVNPMQSHGRYSGLFQKNVIPMQSHGRYGGFFQEAVNPVQSHGSQPFRSHRLPDADTMAVHRRRPPTVEPPLHPPAHNTNYPTVFARRKDKSNSVSAWRNIHGRPLIGLLPAARAQFREIVAKRNVERVQFSDVSPLYINRINYHSLNTDGNEKRRQTRDAALEPLYNQRQFRHRSPVPPHSQRQFGDRSSLPPHGQRQFGDRSPLPPHSQRQFGDRSPLPPHSQRQFDDRSPLPPHSQRQSDHRSPMPPNSQRQSDHRSPLPPNSQRQFGDRSPLPPHSQRQFGDRSPLPPHSQRQLSHSSFYDNRTRRHPPNVQNRLQAGTPTVRRPFNINDNRVKVNTDRHDAGGQGVEMAPTDRILSIQTNNQPHSIRTEDSRWPRPTQSDGVTGRNHCILNTVNPTLPANQMPSSVLKHPLTMNWNEVRRRGTDFVDLKLGSKRYTNEELDAELKCHLAWFVLFHVDLLRLTREMNAIISVFMGTLFLINIIIYGLTMILISSVDKITLKELLILLVSAEVVTLFFTFTLMSGMITDQASAVGQAAYNCNWIEASHSFKRSILVIMTRCQRLLTIKPTGIEPFNLKLFREVTTTAYRTVATLKSFFK